MKNASICGIIWVSQYIKDLLDRDGALTGLLVRGELSNYKARPSGRYCFPLKDAEETIRRVIFRRGVTGLRFRPENGMKVMAFGRVTVFPRDGQYQLYCSGLTPDGVGDLHVAFEQLKQKLHQEGLFDPARKKPAPRYPRKTVLITPPAGTAVRDMLRILRARWPLAEVLVLLVRVQGAEAPGELCTTIAWANQHRVTDLLVTGRGGDSMEDLWAFNDEDVARIIYVSEISVISVVGHKPGVTVADFVASLRVAAPFNVVELAVSDRNECYGWLEQIEDRLAGAMGRRLERVHRELEQTRRCRVLQDPVNYINDRRMLLGYQRDRLAHGLTGAIDWERECFARLAAALDILDPLKILGRGYATPQRSDGTVLRSTKEAMPNETLLLRMADGRVSCKVIEAVGQGRDEVDGGEESNP